MTQMQETNIAENKLGVKRGVRGDKEACVQSLTSPPKKKPPKNQNKKHPPQHQTTPKPLTGGT